jgi:hypothetical protein
VGQLGAGRTRRRNNRCSVARPHPFEACGLAAGQVVIWPWRRQLASSK